MILPKLNTITYSLKLPSNDKEITFRPFTVEEEKILLMAQESNDNADILRAMRQIINNCVQTEIDVSKMPTFDIEPPVIVNEFDTYASCTSFPCQVPAAIVPVLAILVNEPVDPEIGTPLIDPPESVSESDT